MAYSLGETMNSEEYLQLLTDNFSQIESLVSNYHPYYQHVHHHAISAAGAERACELAREEIRKEKKEPNLFEALQNKDYVEINRICNAVWFVMPESMESRYEPGFNVLCDLCSEFPDDIEVDFDEKD
jgi:hypothetical protein